MDKRDRVWDFVADLSGDELVNMWNGYNSDDEKEVHSMGEFDSYFNGLSPYEVADMVSDGEFCSGDNFFTYGWNGLYTSSDPDELIDVDELIDYIVDEDDDMGEPELRDILDAEDDEDEE